MAASRACVFVTGGTGYLGAALVPALVTQGYAVHALVRPGSATEFPSSVAVITGDALDAQSFAAAVPTRSTIVHLVGTPHSNPSKAAEFRRVDLGSIAAATLAAKRAGAVHIVYVSVAHPAPMMRAYIAARIEGEALVRAAGIAATIVRPWYVLGPGHRWPIVLAPLYALARALPWTRKDAERLGLVTRDQMIATLLDAVAHPPRGVRVVEVPEIRRRP